MPNERDHAVVIGIKDYGSLKPPLSGPVLDAEAFANWLKSPNGGDLLAVNVRQVLSTTFDNSTQSDALGFKPDLTAMRRPLWELMALTKNQFGKKAPLVGRRLYLYFSGHGITPRVDPITGTNQSGLLAANCVEDVNYDAIAGYAYAEWFRLSHAFDEILLFMDCCRTDRPDIAPAPITTPIVQGGTPDDVRVFYAWATGWDSRAFEQPLGNPAQTRGVFTFALLDALENALPDEQGQLTTKGLVGHLKLRVTELREGAQQQPPTFFPPEPDGRFVIRQQPQATRANVTITFAPALFGRPVDLQHGQFKSVLPAPHTASDEPWQLQLEPGIYNVVLDGRDIQLVVRPNQPKVQHIDG